MTIPFSSGQPDAVQKVLGLTGGAGTVEEALLGLVVTMALVWGLLKGLSRLRRKKP